MKMMLAFALLLAALTAHGQERRVVGAPPDVTKDWPKPQLRPGLAPDQAAAAVAGYAQTLVDGDHFSGVVLVAHDGQPLLLRAWGLADRANGTPNAVDTKFNLGSIGKVFTKKAIEQLAAAGKLSLDDTVRKRLPDYPSPVADRITIRQLLDHTSGLGDFFGPRYRAAPPAKLNELSDFLPLFADQPLAFEPGSSQRYSNAGYVVLGLIVERVTGEKYRDYVQKRIFAPAGMSDSGFWGPDETVGKRAAGYTMRGPEGPLAERRSNEFSLPGHPSSAGGVYSTATDLLRYFHWSKENGLGVAGGSPGVNASAEVAAPWVVIVLSNYDPPSAEFLTRNAMAIIRGHEAAEEAAHAGPGPQNANVDARHN